MKPEREARAVDELTSGGRLLVTRLQFLGDVLLSLPLVRSLRSTFPNAEIDYLTRDPAAEMLRGEPGFARVFRLPEKPEGARAMLGLIRQLRARGYSAVIDLYSNPRSALMMWLTGARMRIGGNRRGRRHLYTHATTVPPYVRSAADHHLQFGKPLGVNGETSKPTLSISEAEGRAARALFEQLGVNGRRPLIGIHPGGKWEVKRWPVDQFVSLVERLVDRHGMQPVVFCGRGEAQYRRALQVRLGERAVYPPTLPVRETAAMIEALDGLVVCDGGIMHVSVAVGTPTVGIFGSSEPDIWFPYERFGPYVPACVPITCRPCHSHTCSHVSCLTRLMPEMVEQKLLDVLGHPGASQLRSE